MQTEERIPTLKSINLEHEFNEESFLVNDDSYGELTI